MNGTTDEYRHHADASQILKAISDEGKLHVAVIHKTKHWRQRHGKKRHSGQWSTAQALPAEPKQRGNRDAGNDIGPGQRIADVDIPQRINHSQLGRPQQFTGVEPQGVCRDVRPLDQRVAQRKRLPRGVNDRSAAVIHSATRKNGISRTRSVCVTRPHCHQ